MNVTGCSANLSDCESVAGMDKRVVFTTTLYCPLEIYFFISSFGIYGAAVVPDSGVGNTWQERLAIILKQGF